MKKETKQKKKHPKRNFILTLSYNSCYICARDELLWDIYIYGMDELSTWWLKWVASQESSLNTLWLFSLGLVKGASLLYQTNTLEEVEGRIQIISSIPQKFLMKSVDAIPGRIEKLVEKSGAHIEFWIEPHAKRFPFISISCKIL